MLSMTSLKNYQNHWRYVSLSTGEFYWHGILLWLKS